MLNTLEFLKETVDSGAAPKRVATIKNPSGEASPFDRDGEAGPARRGRHPSASG
jgi:hypothetical protein